MGRVKRSVDGSGKLTLVTRYRQSDQFDASHFVNKYYLSPDDKERLFPANINALETIEFELADEVRIKIWDGEVPDDLPECTISYEDIGLVKQVDSALVRRALLAVSQYRQDLWNELTPEEVRAALNLNDWLRKYEKTLLAKQLSLEEELENGLRGNDPFLVDYEIDLSLDFYVRDNDPYYDNDGANEHDWDMDSALMCRLKYLSAHTSHHEINDPDYWGLGDEQDHNDMRGNGHSNPVYQAKHSSLFHELTEHFGVPHKHLIRIGMIWADFEVRYQNAVDIDLTGERIVAKQQETWKGKLEEASSVYRGPLYLQSEDIAKR